MTNAKKPLAELKSVAGVRVIATDKNGQQLAAKAIFRYEGDTYLIDIDGYGEIRWPGSHLTRA